VKKANNLLLELNGILKGLDNTNPSYSVILGLVSSITAAVRQNSDFVASVNSTFASATTNATSTIMSSISELLTTFNTMLQLIGIMNSNISATPVPFTTPVPIPTPSAGENSIVGYYNLTVDIYKTITTKYNDTIGYYNSIIGKVNDINTLANTITSAIGSNFKLANDDLLAAQGIMKNYFPGGITPTPGKPFSYPSTYAPIPPLTTLVEYIIKQINQSYLNLAFFNFIEEFVIAVVVDIKSVELSAMRSGFVSIFELLLFIMSWKAFLRGFSSAC
jgi:hypothetical protein